MWVPIMAFHIAKRASESLYHCVKSALLGIAHREPGGDVEKVAGVEDVVHTAQHNFMLKS